MADPERTTSEQILQLFRPVIESTGMTLIAHEQSPYFGDTALTLRSDDIEVRLLSDRGRFFAEIRPAQIESKWFDLSLLEMLVTGEDTLDGVPIEAQALFLRQHLEEVKRALDRDRWPVTIRQLQALGRRRMPRLFGPYLE